ncbi:hybrid sensor histidine kinase/response regulator [Halopseudomonas salina]|uniref:histidine kinase n=1 Tax=Halopseudomonas salina TaxID=1323744 RepID=A0ABQ1NYZ4_9GAMM|nr:hybrid sensor histidine kinase/response regulator [Halopseudomonas salina]GGC87985.1 hybrid sensor histidine kinase/response regulator [Halopseudomonas salina]
MVLSSITVLEDANQRINLSSHARILEDPDQRHRLADLLANPPLPWKTVSGTHINMGKNGSAWWVAVALDNRTGDDLAGVLEINYPILDRVELFHIDPLQNLEYQRSGDHLLLEQRPMQVRNPWLSLNLPPGINRIYLRVESSSTIFVPLYFATWPAAVTRLEMDSLAQGLFYGVMLGLFAYNLFLYISLRETSYLWYLVYNLNMLLFMAAFDGLLWKWLSMGIAFQSVSIYCLMYLHCIVATQFSRHFLHTAEHFHRIDRLLRTLILLVGITLISLPVIGLSLYNMLASLYVLGTSALLLATGIYVWRQGFRYGSYYTLAWGVLLCSLMLSTAGSLGFELGVSYGTDWVKLGICMELFILSLGLADRINALKEARFKADEQARQARLESRAQGRFLAKMSHEIRTPLNGVLGMVELLRDTPMSSAQQFYVRTISNSGKTLMSVINAVLDYARIESGHVRLERIEFDIEELVSDTCSLFTAQALARNLDLYCSIDPAVPRRVIGDPTRLKQILLNLVGNGLKFTHRGHVTLHVDSAEIADAKGHYRISFEVRDTGIGIGIDAQRDLFDSFTQADSTTTRRYGGSGLGLAISQELASLMGGRIKVYSAPDEGAQFSFSLALSAPGQSDGAEPPLPWANCAMLVGCDQAALDCYSALLLRSGLMVQVRSASMPVTAPPDDCLLVIATAGMNETELERFALMVAERRPPSLVLRSVSTMTEGKTTFGVQVVTCNAPVTPTDLRAALQGLAQRPEFASEPDAHQLIEYPRSPAEIRVLVAEDNPVNQMVVRGLLERYGCKVVLAADGAEAVALYQAEPDHYQLILMDGEMPRVDGFEATRRIRDFESRHDLPAVIIVALTAHALDIHREAGASAGMNHYLAKPVEAKALYAVIDSQLNRDKDL